MGSSRRPLHRARFWRAQGFPNLVLARKARWKGHVKKSERERQAAEKAHTPNTLDKSPWGF
jgi:hypothetical protein